MAKSKTSGKSYFDDEDYGPKKKKSRPLKHSRNLPGQGMRVINNFSEDEDFFGDYDYDNHSEVQHMHS